MGGGHGSWSGRWQGDRESIEGGKSRERAPFLLLAVALMQFCIMMQNCISATVVTAKGSPRADTPL